MSSRVQFQPIFGCNPFEPRCFILKVAEFRLLLDCGWNSKFDLRDIEALTKADLTTIDAVLLSQPDLLHIGALPYAYAKLGLTAPIFATAPIWRMGQYMLMDAFVSIHQSHANFGLFSHEDIKRVFKDKFKAKLKYSQEYPLIKEVKSEHTNATKPEKSSKTKPNTSPPHSPMVRRIGNSNTTITHNTKNGLNTVTHSLTITPYSAGHMVGGTIWNIAFETDNIIYAIDYNIRREKHLNESVFGLMEIRPSLLITDCINIGFELGTIVKRKQRETALYNLCLSTLKNGGNVLLPSDSSGRSLELLYALYASFAKHKDFMRYHLVFLSYTCRNTLISAKSMLEWMCDSCQRELNKSQRNVFDFKELLVCQTISEFKASVKFPYVCVASNELLESGLSQELFLTSVSKHTSNLCLLTQRCHRSTVCGKLFEIVDNGSKKGREIEFDYFRKEKLSAEEKLAFMAKRDQSQQERAEKLRKEREMAIAFEEESDTEMKDAKLIPKKQSKEEMSPEMAIPSSFDRFDERRMRHTFEMFPFNEYDADYGLNTNYMSDYGFKIDLNAWRESVTHSPKKESETHSMDEYETHKLRDSLSPSPNDVVAQTMSLLPSNVLNPDPLQPFKTVCEAKKLFVKCQLKYLNVEGRSDADSVKQTLPTLQPRRIILVHGSGEQKREFKRFLCAEKVCHNGESDIIVAENGKVSELEINVNFHKIIMHDLMERYLSFVQINGFDIAYLSGTLKEIAADNEIDVGDIGQHRHESVLKEVKYKLVRREDRDSDRESAKSESDDIDVKMDGSDKDREEETAISTIQINYPRNDGHSLTYLGDVTKIEMETNLKHCNVAAELYYGGTLVAGKSGEVRITNAVNAQKSVLNIDATLTCDYFDIRDNTQKQFHLI